MASLKGTKTHENLKAAFAGESQANRRYLYFAKVADVEGQPEIAGLFRDTAEGETGHAHGHLDYLKSAGDPATGLPIGDSLLNLKAAVHGETHEYTDMYPGMAKTELHNIRIVVILEERLGLQSSGKDGLKHPSGLFLSP